ncbi:hypothetical protein D9757_005110 [Collybiopsis confluens]|uniref:FAD-binding domain-containing protein n=1 Tax=Collybiopsis confluens TaxID=2823264 RepID=A0A8H5HT07_9AGAR|nr:hypothetical protein D9757_005110 [Collybiopsis confluens]
MMAQALAALGINVVVIERRNLGDVYGNADGLQPRTLEIWQSYGILEEFSQKAAAMHALVTYDKDGENGIKRGIPSRNIVVDCRYPYELTAGIQIIESTLRAQVERHGTQILQPAKPVDITLKLQDKKHHGGVVVTIQHSSKDFTEKGSLGITSIHARYAIGADGAHSWVRQELGVILEGEKTGQSLKKSPYRNANQSNTEYVWGVIDVCVQTDFPDFRFKCIIQSSQGAMIIIPREEDKLRIYVQCSPQEKVQVVRGISNRSFKRLHPKQIASVPQKIANKFRVGPYFWPETHVIHILLKQVKEQMYLWEMHIISLAWVLRGWSDDSLLDTYEIERRSLAIQLIEFDKAISASLDGCEASTYSSMLHEQNLFTSGVGIRYRSRLTVEANDREESLSDTFGLKIGTRLPPMKIIRFADWHPLDIQDLATSDGLFKIIVCAGDLRDEKESKGLREFAESFQQLAENEQESTLFERFTMFTMLTECKESDIWSLMPVFLRNWRRYGADITAYMDNLPPINRVFTNKDSSVQADQNQNGMAREWGTVIVRPDGYISAMLEVSGRSAAFICEYLKHL